MVSPDVRSARGIDLARFGRCGRQPADPLCPNWRHGPLDAQRIQPVVWCSATCRQSLGSGDPALLKAGRPQWPQPSPSGRLLCEQAKATPLNFADASSPTALDTKSALTTRAIDLPNPTPVWDRTSQRPYLGPASSTCDEPVDSSSGSAPAADRNIPLFQRLGRPPSPRDHWCWFARARQPTRREEDWSVAASARGALPP